LTGQFSNKSESNKIKRPRLCQALAEMFDTNSKLIEQSQRTSHGNNNNGSMTFGQKTLDRHNVLWSFFVHKLFSSSLKASAVFEPLNIRLWVEYSVTVTLLASFWAISLDTKNFFGWQIWPYYLVTNRLNYR